MAARRPERDPTRPVYVISVAASIVSVHPRTLRIYEDEGLVCPARTPTNIRLYSENDIRRVLWIRHLTQDRGVNLAGVRILFELEERLGTRILERLYDEGPREAEAERRSTAGPPRRAVDRPDPGSWPRTTGSQPTMSHRTVGRTTRPHERRTRWPSDRPPRTASPPGRAGIRELPLVALRETVIFPEMIVPLQVGREKSVAALNAAVAAGGPIALVTQRAPTRRRSTSRPSSTRSAPSPRSPRSSSSRTAPSGRSSRARRASASTASRRRARSCGPRRGAPRQPPRRGRGQALMRSVQAQIEQYVQTARRSRRRRPSPPATSPSPACSPTWSPTART